ncbi:MAG: coproporphyrinogen dehydrogenase HemZ [Clostridiales bacterium]|nr:coproporphyrinogen dehydrogenase HemZ [Clostridiales bacterium]
MELVCENEKVKDELLYILKLFYNEDEINNLDYKFYIEQIVQDKLIISSVSSSITEIKYSREDFILDERFPLRYLKRYSKLCLFDLLKSVNPDKVLPWGSLTGIRPTKLMYEVINENNGDVDKAIEIFIDDFSVDYDKTMMTIDIINNQKFIEIDENIVDLYINIPFCPTKCYYCSFISAPIDKCSHLLDPYIDALVTEIISTKKLISEKNYTVRSIYMGGGTPSILSPVQFEIILEHLDYKVQEFTVECGRPDTITREKLEVLKKYGVTRISVNPQTFNDKTLEIIGRNHTSNDVIDAYNLAKEFGFTINMDLIAGLSGETLDDFKYSLNKAIECNPDNLTIHTLCVKRGSDLKDGGIEKSKEEDIFEMINYSYNLLKNDGYKPYYMYKQKNMLGNLENIGYFKEKPSIFNIVSMEEFSSIIAVGANAISKRFFKSTNRIERFANVKNIPDYITRIDEMIDKKYQLFK